MCQSQDLPAETPATPGDHAQRVALVEYLLDTGARPEHCEHACNQAYDETTQSYDWKKASIVAYELRQ